MSEIRMQDVTLVGRLKEDPIPMTNGESYFKMDVGEGLPVPCFCDGKTASNMNQHLRSGDELTIEGKLRMIQFKNEKKPIMLVFGRFISYGRKNGPLVAGLPDS